eukprot:8978587-Pyramimonas_sp.AAC.1
MSKGQSEVDNAKLEDREAQLARDAAQCETELTDWRLQKASQGLITPSTGSTERKVEEFLAREAAARRDPPSEPRHTPALGTATPQQFQMDQDDGPPGVHQHQALPTTY